MSRAHAHHDPDDFADLGVKHAQPRIRAADTDLAVSPLAEGKWWTTTKRMIERGSERFWAKRAEARGAGNVPGGGGAV